MIQDISAYLDSSLSTLTAGSNLFVSFLPTSPDIAVAIYESSGQDDLALGGPVMYRTADLQVITRGLTYPNTEALALSVHNLLNKLNITVNSQKYLSFSPVARPVLIDRDQTDRYVFSGNYEIKW